MKGAKEVFWIILVFVSLLILWKVMKQEPFVDRGLETAAQDRLNPLASKTNPLKNPAAEIGISKEKADELRGLMTAALNSPEFTPSAENPRTFIEKFTNFITPRIDDETSLLGMVKFCAAEGKKGNPFASAKFSENCGMCMTSGNLVTGEAFNTPTGIVVWPEDRKRALEAKAESGAKYVSVKPTLNAATCAGPEPNIALTAEDYSLLQRRAACGKHGIPREGCALCLATNKATAIDKTRAPISLALWGSGTAATFMDGKAVGEKATLNESQPTMIPLGNIDEGARIGIKVERAAGSLTTPYIYGAVIGQTGNEKPFVMDLAKILIRDLENGGAKPTTGMPRRFKQAGAFLLRITPVRDAMDLEGELPFTLVGFEQMAAGDCDSTPLVQKQANAELFLTDPCFKGPTDECLRKVIIEAGCSAKGTWYTQPQVARGNMNIADFTDAVLAQKNASKTEPAASMNCLGIDISTPCDPFVGKETIPNEKCLIYLYENKGEGGRLGSTYQSVANRLFTSLLRRQPQFCQQSGTLNPRTVEGRAELETIARNGYGGVKGLDAVKSYLAAVYQKATGNLDLNLSDDKGGRQTSWMKCYGAPVAVPSPTTISTNAAGNVGQEVPRCEGGLPTAPVIRANNLIGQIYNSGNYILSFKITPASAHSDWGSVLHFSTTGNNCCGAGDRLPGIWIIPGAQIKLHIVIGDNKDGNWRLNDSVAIPIGKESNVKIEAVGSKVIITINSNVTVLNQPTGRPQGMCRVWAGDPFYPPARATIRDLCFTNI